jgi:xanthine dehydrogenase accessory factor
MSDTRAIVAAARALREGGRPYLLATLVAVRGSSYRRPGARLLIAEDRGVAGSVSGGCLERDLARRGWWQTAGGRPALVTYDSTSEEDDVGWGLGLGCNGVVELLLERYGGAANGGHANGGQANGGHDDGGHANGGHDDGRRDERTAVDPLAFIEGCLDDQVDGALVTVFRSAVSSVPVGTRLGLRADAAAASCTLDGERRARQERPERQEIDHRARGLEQGLLDQARAALSASAGARAVTRPGAEKSAAAGRTIALAGGAVEALVEVIRPPPHLFVFGSGPDAVPVVALARGLGWTVTVWDPQARFETRTRFAAADHLSRGAATALAAAIEAAARPLAVVMSHNVERDGEALAMLLPSRALYIGVLGPRRRTDRLLGELAGAGLCSRAGDDRRLHAPVGLDVGAETPDEVALAILAEAQAVLAGAAAGSLCHRPGAIHAVAATDAAGTPAAPAPAATETPHPITSAPPRAILRASGRR